MTFTTAHSLWLAPLCLALGVLLAWFLYRRKKGADGFAPRLALLLAIMRACAIALIAFFLLEPMVRHLVREVRKPVVVLLHDGSSSLLATGDSTRLRSIHAAAMQELAASLSNDYQVRSFTYGDHVRDGLSFDQQDGFTDMGQALREVYDRFTGADLGALIIDGDGIINRGRDPRLDVARLGVPVYTIALGDTTVRPDLVLKGVEHNRICFLGNEFPLLARVAAHHLKGVRSRIVVKHGGRELASQEMSAAGDPWLHEFAFSIKAETAGTQRYTVSVVPVEGEHTVLNNAQEIFIDVLDDSQKVLLLGAAPHPDLGSLRLALDGLEGYETDLAFAADFTGAVEDYDLIVLHQLPSVRLPIAALLQRAEAKGIPLLAVIGGATDAAAFNKLGVGVRASGTTSGAITDAQASPNMQFAAYVVDADLFRAMERFPPLQVPFGQYELARSAEALATQRVGVVRTNYPLIALTQQNERRMAAICGEGIWRWRIADHRLNGSTERFDRLVHRLVQFLALKADKKRFRVDHLPVFTSNEPVLINAELYDAAYQPITDAEVNIRLKDEQGREFPYLFRAASAAYRLDAGKLPPGRYTWEATAVAKGERSTAKGDLVVRELFIERLSTVADHALLADMAARTNGRMVPADSIAAIGAAIRAERAIVARSYAHAQFTDLITLRWIFFVLLGLLAVEWVLRRRNGSY
ncbi:MAG: VWA domain-containing protein [Flavobacteriales bacterium]|nr:VWA domain-containing protein [Flavobacteriales bacterium]